MAAIAPKPNTMQAMKDGVVPPGKKASIRNMMRAAGKKQAGKSAKKYDSMDEGDHEYR